MRQKSIILNNYWIFDGVLKWTGEISQESTFTHQKFSNCWKKIVSIVLKNFIENCNKLENRWCALPAVTIMALWSQRQIRNASIRWASAVTNVSVRHSKNQVWSLQLQLSGRNRIDWVGKHRRHAIFNGHRERHVRFHQHSTKSFDLWAFYFYFLVSRLLAA